MISAIETRGILRGALAAAVLSAGISLPGQGVALQVTLYKQAVAETAAKDEGLAAFYRERQFEPIWVTDDDRGRARRAALLGAVDLAEAHGLPADRYRREDILALMAQAESERDRGRVEVELSRILAAFASDLESGILVPSRIDSNIVREIERRSTAEILAGFAAAEEPSAYLRKLAPRSPEYGRLLREKLKLERRIELGGWGPAVSASSLAPGDSGAGVVELRNRLIAMGYLDRTPTSTYDAAITAAVRQFQEDHGLEPDGTVGGRTLSEINTGPERRLGQVLVAMERERWLPEDRGERHVWVNLTDFKARIIDKGEITFETRSVIGKHQDGRRTPEFSDVMEHMVINPSWYVPRSIVVNEYLPVLKRNPYALGYMEIVDSRGRPANRAAGFSRYSARTFPFSMRQPPSERNALGLVKFMFPNKYNIYLHDTPSKSLFERTVRDFSHGCIRLQQPFEFAYALLALQEDDPRSYFQSILNSGRETRVELEEHVPVHLGYRTAYTKPRGGLEFRDDIYGRDEKILAALRQAGVRIPDVLS